MAETAARKQWQAVEEFFDTLGEVHDDTVCGAIEPLGQAGEQVGLGGMYAYDSVSR